MTTETSAREQDLGVLRTAKLAMSEGLIGEEEYNQIKNGFTKAQMIKAGMDAGFLKEEYYQAARDSFLQALDFKVFHQPVQPAPAPAAPAAAVTARTATSPRRSHNVPPLAFAAPAAHHHALGGLVSQRSGGSNGAITPQASGPAVQVGLVTNGPLADGAVPIPTDLPRLGKAGVADGKKSMSGITLTDICINLFNHIKSKSAYKWVIYKIDDAGSQVVPEQLGAPTASYEQFVGALPEGQCRYGVYDYAYHNNDTQQTVNKLVFIHWAPEGSTIKSKMMYASTKDFFKSYLEGVGAELQATDVPELQESELRERVHQALTRK